MKPWQGIRRVRAVAATATVLVGLAVGACAAAADESAWPTTQAVAYHAEWVPYLDPPPVQAAVCLVDTGVNVTPDTPADSPDGPIVKRLSLDGGPGTAANSSWEGLHGTRMAFVGAAPINGWGTAGFWPGARIISIRATDASGTTFPFDYYSKAAELCSLRAASEHIAAVNLSLNCECQPTPTERARLANQIVRAHSNDESIVAAVGNSAGPIGSPASEPGVFAVAAGGQSPVVCSFSNRGVGVDLIAPGCGLDFADPTSGQIWSGYQSGTSGASMTASVVLALLRSYRPDLGWAAAEQLLTSSAQPTEDGPILDVESLFRAAGLGTAVDAARARVPSTDPSSAAELDPIGGVGASPGQASATTAPEGDGGISVYLADRAHRYAPPQIAGVSRAGRRVVVKVRNRPVGVRLILALQARSREFSYRTVAKKAGAKNALALRLPRRWNGGRILARFEQHANRSSPWAYRPVAR